MRRTWRWGAACSLAVLGCDRTGVARALTAAQSTAIDRLLESQMAGHRIPGLALAVVKNGGGVKQVVLGLANVESGMPVSATTPFQVASTTKSFSATAVLLLVGEGRLKLTGRIRDRIPGLPPTWQDVTVRQLLTYLRPSRHRSHSRPA